MTGHPVDLRDHEPMSAVQLADVLRHRDLQFRTRGVQVMLLCALTLRPLPPDVADRIADYAHELCVDDAMIGVARQFAAGSLALAAIDFERNGYTATWRPEDISALHTTTEIESAWNVAVHDAALARHWACLGSLPANLSGGRSGSSIVVLQVAGSAPY